MRIQEAKRECLRCKKFFECPFVEAKKKDVCILRREGTMTLYMKVSQDEFELPLAVAVTVKELSEMTGKNYKDLNSIFSRIRNGKKNSKIYKIVEVEEDGSGDI